MKIFKRSVIVLLIGAAVYAGAGFWIVPGIVENRIEHSVAAAPSLRLELGDVDVNPFTFFITISDITLADDSRRPILSIGRVERHFRLAGRLWEHESGPTAQLLDLRVPVRGSEATLASAPAAFSTGLSIDTVDGSITLGRVRIQDPEFRLIRDDQKRFVLPSWLASVPTSPLPLRITAGRLDIEDGTATWIDESLSPPLELRIGDIAGSVVRSTAEGDHAVTLVLQGRVGAAGTATVRAISEAATHAATITVEAAFRQLDLNLLSAYFEQLVGRPIAAGTGSLKLDYAHHDGTIDIDNRLVIDGLRLGESQRTDDSRNLPLELFAALVTDANDRIDISLPMQDALSRVDSEPGERLAGSLAAYIRQTASRPFRVLASLYGRDDLDLGQLAFRPGSAAFTPAAAEKIALLARALGQRPLLGLDVRPAYAPGSDRDAIAARQVRLHVTLATSTRPAGNGDEVLLDFDDPKVRDVLDEFAGIRLGEPVRMAIARRFGDRATGYYRALFDALVVNEDVSPAALRRLAHYRVQAVLDALEARGIAGDRLSLDDRVETRNDHADAVIVRLDTLALPRPSSGI